MAVFKWSLAALMAGNAADGVSSWQRPEMNPILGPQFNSRAVAIKFGIVGATALLERALVKKHPELAKGFAVANFTAAGVFTGVAIRNLRQEK